jgi:hypothetical protein
MPPGRRYAATKSNAKKMPMFRAPSTADRHHQRPRGSIRVNASSSRPAGKARSAPASSGRPGGRNSVVTAYVVPQTAGVTAVISRTGERVITNSLDVKYLDVKIIARGYLLVKKLDVEIIGS